MIVTGNAHLTVSRGELYFDRFLPGTTTGEGELYLGNTPGFSVSRKLNTRDRVASYGGRKVVSDSLPISEEFSASITTDNISFENIALWFGAEVDDTGQPGLGFMTEAFKVKRSRFYQLGKTANQFGLRYLESISVEKLLDDLFVPIGLNTNLSVSRTEGRFSVREDAPDIVDGDTIRVHFQNRSTTTKGLTKRRDEVIGSLRFVSTNPVGAKKDYLFPSVRMLPTGEIPFKGDQWQEFSFEIQIRKLNPKIEYLYILERGEGIYTRDEQGIVDHGGIYVEDFPIWENELDIIINVTMPARGY